MTSSMDVIPETSGQFKLGTPANLNFGITTLPNITKLQQSSSEIFSSAEYTQPTAHAPTPDWVSSIMARFNQHDDRLSQLEHLVAENQRLRKELHSANLKIQELEKQTVNKDDFPALESKPKQVQGSEASHWANFSDTRQIENSTQSTSSSFLAAATKGQKATPPPTVNKVKRSRRITPRQYQAITRTFTSVSDSSGYQYIYLPSRYREPISSLRTKLRKLKINNGRVLDVHFPDNHIVALLVHNDYAEELLSIFTKAGVKPVDNFDPLDSQRLRNPLFANLNQEERQSKCVEIHQARLLRAIDHIRDSVRVAVARDFLRKQWITADQFKSIARRSTVDFSQTNPNADQPDSDMVEVLDTFVATSPASSKSLTGDGEPVEVDL